MSVRTYGIYLCYPPQVDLRAQGLGRQLSAFLRAAEKRRDVSFVIACPSWMRGTLRRLCDEAGVDFQAIARAFWADVQHKQFVQGGSTITQQFVKNAYVDNTRSIARKLKEAILARQLDQRWSKDRILTEYLNTIYFGNGAYGIEQAARTYFHHSAAKLKLEDIGD